MNKWNAKKQWVEPSTRRSAACEVETTPPERTLESSLFISSLRIDAVKDATVKDIVQRLDHFVSHSKKNIQDIANAHAKAKHKEVEGLAASLADLCSQMGAVNMLRLCYQIQIGARQRSEISPLIEKLQAENAHFSHNIAHAG